MFKARGKLRVPAFSCFVYQLILHSCSSGGSCCLHVHVYRSNMCLSCASSVRFGMLRSSWHCGQEAEIIFEATGNCRALEEDEASDAHRWKSLLFQPVQIALER